MIACRAMALAMVVAGVLVPYSATQALAADSVFSRGLHGVAIDERAVRAHVIRPANAAEIRSDVKWISLTFRTGRDPPDNQPQVFT